MEQLPFATDKFFGILHTIFSTLDIDEILTTVVKEIQLTLGADRCTLYLIDRESNVLYSKVLQAESLIEIRVPLTRSSIAGYSAITKKIVNVIDAYDNEELKHINRERCFDKRWDRESGYRTRSVLAIPIPIRTDGSIIGVFQALNKTGGFSGSDIATMECFSYLLNIALNNALLYQTIDEEKSDEVLLHGFKKIALLEVLEVQIIPYLDDKGKVKRLITIFTPIDKKSSNY